MKLSKEYILRAIADTWVVLPLGAAAINFNGMITLNETGALLWKTLEQGADQEDLVDALCAEYIVERDQALTDVKEFLEKLNKAGCLEL